MTQRRVEFVRLCICLGALSWAVAGCTSKPPTPKVEIKAAPPLAEPIPSPSLSNGPTSGAEAFSAAQYGVSASPRVGTGPRLKRGGGYNKIGSSYVVKGRRYYPTSTPRKTETGRASWYGKAFHGRLTANGEVFDMNHLTAAHKTMPLPSYARVTNLANGRSIIVRVNDRGPFSNNRLIDLSKKAAEVLDFTKQGTAQVKVEYAGRAPLHGNDDDYLLASMRGVPGSSSRPVLASAQPTAAQHVQSRSSFPQIPPRPSVGVSAYRSLYADWRVRSAFSGIDTDPNWK